MLVELPREAMTERPRVSVCMPARNAERWLGAAIESVLSQTYESFELVISDNASSDRTAEIARSHADPRLLIHAGKTRIAPIANHNRSVQLSRGDYVKFLHADDMLLPACLEENVALVLEDPAIGLVFAPREVLLESTRGEENAEWAQSYAHLHERFTDLGRSNDGRTLFRQILASGIDRNWIGEPSSVLTTRACLAEVGLFKPRLRQIADFDLWLRIMLSHRVGYIGHSLSVYRHHDDSMTATNAQLGRDWLDRLWLLEGLLAEELDPGERATVRHLRDGALRLALRMQTGRLARGRLSGELIGYGAYRARSLAGRPPRLHNRLEPRWLTGKCGAAGDAP